MNLSCIYPAVHDTKYKKVPETQMMWVLKNVYILRQARNVLRYYLPRLSPPSLGAWLLSEIRDIFGPSLQLTLCSTSTFIWLQSRLDILLGSVAQKNALLRSDCFNETLPLIFWDGIAWLVGVNAHIYLTLYQSYIIKSP